MNTKSVSPKRKGVKALATPKSEQPSAATPGCSVAKGQTLKSACQHIKGKPRKSPAQVRDCTNFPILATLNGKVTVREDGMAVIPAGAIDPVRWKTPIHVETLEDGTFRLRNSKGRPLNAEEVVRAIKEKASPAPVVPSEGHSPGHEPSEEPKSSTGLPEGQTEIPVLEILRAANVAGEERDDATVFAPGAVMLELRHEILIREVGPGLYSVSAKMEGGKEKPMSADAFCQRIIEAFPEAAQQVADGAPQATKTAAAETLTEEDFALIERYLGISKDGKTSRRLCFVKLTKELGLPKPRHPDQLQCPWCGDGQHPARMPNIAGEVSFRCLAPGHEHLDLRALARWAVEHREEAFTKAFGVSPVQILALKKFTKKPVAVGKDGPWIEKFEDPDGLTVPWDSKFQSPFPVYYHDKRGRYLIADSDGSWESVDRDTLKVLWQVCGLGASRHALALHEVIQHCSVSWLGPVAGKMAGCYRTESGRKILVTASPKIPAPVKGEWSMLEALFKSVLMPKDPETGEVDLHGERQYQLFLCWCKWRLESLLGGLSACGQLLALIGPVAGYKTFLLDTLGMLFGGRVSLPFQYATGQTSFNGEMAGTELLMFDDEMSDATRREISEVNRIIKELTVRNRKARVHAKGQDQSILELNRACVLAGNIEEPANFAGVGDPDGSNGDKMLLLLAGKGKLNVPNATIAEKKTVNARRRKELHAFVHFLLYEYEFPEWLPKDERFGIKYWHHPKILAALWENTKEETLAAVLRETVGKVKATVADPSNPKKLTGAATNVLMGTTSAIITALNKAAGRDVCKPFGEVQGMSKHLAKLAAREAKHSRPEDGKVPLVTRVHDAAQNLSTWEIRVAK